MNQKVKFGIFTKPIHTEKLVNYLNQNTDLDYIISTQKPELLAYDFDVGVSYCFPHIVNVNYHPVGNRRIWYNYHPAPLPDYPRDTNYALAIRDKVKEYGVSLHIMTMDIDKGPLLEVKRFMLDSLPTNSNELGAISHYYLFQLFKETIELLARKPTGRIEFSRIKRKS